MMFKSRALAAAVSAIAIAFTSLVALPAAAATVIPAPTNVSVTSYPDGIGISFDELTENQIVELGVADYEYSIDNGVSWCARNDDPAIQTMSPIFISAAADNEFCFVESSGSTTADIAMTNAGTYTVLVRAVPDVGESGAASTGISARLGYEVTFDAHYGQGDPFRLNFPLVAPLRKLPEPTGFSSQGMVFAGWATTPEEETILAAGTVYTPTEATTLYAVWRELSYRVTFDANGGTSETAYLNYIVGQEGIYLPEPTRYAYKFDGWFTAQDVKAKEPYAPTADITLKAKWSIDNNLAFNIASRSQMAGARVSFSTTGGYGSGAVSYTASPSSCVLSFANDIHQLTVAASITSNVICTLTATKAASTGVPAMTATTTVAFVKTPETPTKPLNPKVIYAPDSILVNFESPANALQSFVAGYEYSTDQGTTWSYGTFETNADGKTIDYTIAMQSNEEALVAGEIYKVKIRAISFTEGVPSGEPTATLNAALGYSISFDANDGVGTMPNLNIALEQSELLPASTFTRTNYRVAGWSSSPSGQVEFANKSLFAPDGTVTVLYAVWVPAKFTLTLDLQGGSATSSSVAWNTDSTTGPTLPTPTRTAYNFIGWAFDAEAGPEAIVGTFLPTANTTLYAIWELNNNVTVTVSSPAVASTTSVKLGYTGGFGTTKVVTYSLTEDSDASCHISGSNLTFVSVDGAVDADCWVLATIAASSNGQIPLMTSLEAVEVTFTDGAPDAMPPVITGLVFKPTSILVKFNAPANATDAGVVKYIYSTDGETWADATVAWATGNKSGTITISRASSGDALDADSEYPILISTQVRRSGELVDGEPSGEEISASLGYVVTFDANGGRDPEGLNVLTQNLPKSEQLQRTLDPLSFERASYEFIGWSTNKAATANSDGILGDEEAFTPAADTKLYAIWRSTLYNVTIDAKGGVADVTKLVFDSLGETPVTLPNATRFAYNFVGWFTLVEGEEQEVASELFPESDMTVFAKWEVNNTLVLDVAAFEAEGNMPVALTVSGDLGDGKLTYTTNEVCSVVSGKLVAKTPGTCTVRATKGKGNVTINKVKYAVPEMSTEDIEVEFTAAEQTLLEISNTKLSTPANTTITLTTRGGSGTGLLTYELPEVGEGETSLCKVEYKNKQWILSVTEPTNCEVTAFKAGSGVYLETASETVPFEFTLVPQAKLSIANKTLSGSIQTDVLLTSKGGSGTGEVTYEVSDGECSIEGNTLRSDVIATCAVIAYKAGSGWYDVAESSVVTFKFTGYKQAPMLLSNSVLSWSALESVTLEATGGTGDGEIYFESPTSGCSIEGDTLSVTKPTTCVVVAYRGDDGTYAVSAPSAAKKFVFSAAPQSTVSISNEELNFEANATVELTAEGGDGSGAYAFATATKGCTIRGALLTVDKPVTCVIVAKRAASEIYAVSANSQSVSFVFAPASQAAIEITNASLTNQASQKIKLQASGGSGKGAFSYATASEHCSIAGDVLTVSAITSCEVVATKAANGVYASVESEAVTFEFTAASQAEVKIANKGKDLSKIAGTTVTLKAAGGSGTGSYSFATETEGCFIEGAVLTTDREVNCEVTATRAESGIYLESAPSAVKVFVFVGLSQSAVTLDTPASTQAADSTVTLTASGGSGEGEPIFRFDTATAGCVIDGDTLSVTRPTTCVVAAVREGTGLLGDKASATKKFVFTALSQADLTITTDNTSSTKVGTTLQISVSGGSGEGALSYSVKGKGCAISKAGVLSSTKAASCSVTVTKAASGLFDKKSVTKAFAYIK